MKALLISESEDILNTCTEFFAGCGYESLRYRWLLKAMDNLEEIAAQLVFIDGTDYPRHWKTLAGHIRACLKNNPLIFLYSETLNDEEKKKAQFLNVHCIVGSIQDKKKLEEIKAVLPFSSMVYIPLYDRVQKKTAAETVQADNEKTSEAKNIDNTAYEGVVCAETFKAAALRENKTEDMLVKDDGNAEAAALKDTAEGGTEKNTDNLQKAAEHIPAQNKNTVNPENENNETEKKITAAEEENIFEDYPQYSKDYRLSTDTEPASELAAIQKTGTDKGAEAHIFTFVHPVTKVHIKGNITKYEPPLLFFRPDNAEFLHSMRFGQRSGGTIEQNGILSDVFVQVQGLDNDTAEVCILKYI